MVAILMNMALLSQEKVTITGIVKDVNNKVLPFSDVLLTTADSSSNILAFDMADANGFYEIEWVADTAHVRVVASSMGYDKTVEVLAIIPGKTAYRVDFKLNERVEEIAEVSVVASPKVIERNDTTFFNLEKLTDGTEVVVEDILKKLPGIEQAGDGKFKFKGKDVKHVLLDGDDLFENNYTLGTKNIQADQIKGVEAVENYSENPLLRGVEITEDVALNLKFKPGLSLSNNIDLGYGYKDRYDISHKSIAVTKKVKAFTLFNHNTLGRNSGHGRYKASGHISGLGMGDKMFKAPSFLETASTGSLFKAQQSERNNAFFGSINIMPRTSETSVVRLNLNFFSDEAVQERYKRTVIKTDPENPIVIEESDKKGYDTRFFNAKLYAEKFFSESSSMESSTTFSRLKNTSDNVGFMNNQPQNLNSSSSEHYFKHHTGFTKKLNKNTSIVLNGTLASDESPEQLTLVPGIDYETNKLAPGESNIQDILSKKQSANISVTYFRRLSQKHRVNLSMGSKYFKNRLESNLSGIDGGSSFSNNIDYEVFSPGASLNYEYQYDKFRVNPVANVNLYNYSHNDKKADNKQQDSDLLLDASLRLEYMPSKKHKFSANIRMDQSPPEERRLYNEFILVSNRSMQNNTLSFEASKRESAGLGYSYNNLYDEFRAGINLNYSKNDGGYMSNHLITEDVSYRTYYYSDKGSSSYSGSANISKFVAWLRSDIRLNTSYSISEYFNSVNSDEVRQNESNSWSSRLDIRTRFIWKFVFENKTSYSSSIFYSQGEKKSENESLSNRFIAVFQPWSRLKLKSNFNYIIPSLRNSENNNKFLDASLQYSNKKKTILYRIEGNNLLAQKATNTIQNSDYYEVFTNQALQQRYVLFSMEFRF